MTFLACLRAGVVAVPVYPPDPRKMKKDISMFVTVTQNCQAKTALTCSMYYNVKKISAIKEKFTFSGAAQWPEHLSWVVTDDLVDAKGIDPAKHWLTQSPSANSTAFLQYTSGSTSAPKGVVLAWQLESQPAHYQLGASRRTRHGGSVVAAAVSRHGSHWRLPGHHLQRRNRSVLVSVQLYP